MTRLRKAFALVLLELASMVWPYGVDTEQLEYAWRAYGWMRGSKPVPWRPRDHA
jgi:hypothetical protein